MHNGLPTRLRAPDPQPRPGPKRRVGRVCPVVVSISVFLSCRLLKSQLRAHHLQEAPF